jgi:hypothetical protein
VQLLASLKCRVTPLTDMEIRVLGEQRRAGRERMMRPPRPWERER